MTEAIETEEALVADPDDAPETPNPAKLNSLQRMRRDVEMVRLMRVGVTTDAVGAMYGLSGRQARKIRDAYKGEPLEDLETIDGKQIVADMLDQYDVAISDLAMLAQTTKQDAVKIAAIRSRLEAAKGRFEMAQQLGIVPHELGTITLRDDWIRLARIIVRVLEAWEVPEAVQNAILDAVEGRPPELPEGKTIAELGEEEEIVDATEVSEEVDGEPA